MQIITRMNDHRFDTVCETSVKLVEQLKALLTQHGLAPSEAASVLAMAAGGVIKGLDVDPEEFMQAAYVSYQMWRRESGSDNLDGMVFDPAHKKPGFEAVQRDPSREN